MAGLTREHEPCELALAGRVGIPDDQLVAVAVAGEVPEQRARAQVGLLAPHALKARLEVLAQQLAPLLSLDSAPTPVQLEQDVRVEMGIDLVESDLELAHSPERRLRDRIVGARGAADRRIGHRRGVLVDDRGLLAKRLRRCPRLRDQPLARLRVDELIHLRQPLEGVLAVEHAGLVGVIRFGPVRVQDPQAEVAIDRGAADQDGERQPALVELLDACGHLLRGRDQQRREADRGRVMLDRSVEDRRDRDLLAEVDDRVAVVGQDRVDE